MVTNKRLETLESQMASIKTSTSINSEDLSKQIKAEVLEFEKQKIRMNNIINKNIKFDQDFFELTHKIIGTLLSTDNLKDIVLSVNRLGKRSEYRPIKVELVSITTKKLVLMNSRLPFYINSEFGNYAIKPDLTYKQRSERHERFQLKSGQHFVIQHSQSKHQIEPTKFQSEPSTTNNQQNSEVGNNVVLPNNKTLKRDR